MAAPEDRAYTTACSRLASLLSISIAAARRRVDLVAAREGVRDSPGKCAIAERLLAEASRNPGEHATLLDGQLTPVASERNFMDED